MLNFNIIRKEALNSTNDYLKQLISKSKQTEGTVIVANNQTKGKGQGANTWESEAGKNITLSLLLKPSFIEACDMFIISKVISLGILNYLNKLGDGFTIKWPNDIYWNNKKICGILIENQLLGCCLNYSTIGIGLNINQGNFISNAPNPVSLMQIFNKTFHIEAELNQLLNSISIWYTTLYNNDFDLINSKYFNGLYRRNGLHLYKTNNDTFSAKIKSVENDGLLQLETSEGALRTFYFKEVEFLI